MATMRHMRAGLLALAAAMLAGCLPEVRRPQSSAPLELPAAPRSEAAPDLACYDLAVIELPLGDDSLESGLWMSENEQAVPLEMLAVLEENGLRVCRLGSALPPRLLSLLNSRASCAGPRRLRDVLGKAVKLPVGPQRRRLAFAVKGGESPRELALADAQCLWVAQARADAEGSVVVRFVPAVKHGAARTRPKAEASPDGPLRWALEPGQACDEFAHLAFEVAVGPGGFVAIGPRRDKRRSLGAAWFNDDAKQRLLLLRAAILPAQAQPDQAGPVAPAVQRKGDARSVIGRRFGFSQ